MRYPVWSFPTQISAMVKLHFNGVFQAWGLMWGDSRIFNFLLQLKEITFKIATRPTKTGLKIKYKNAVFVQEQC